VGDKDVVIDGFCVYGGIRHYRVVGGGLVMAHEITNIRPIPTANWGANRTSQTVRAEYRKRSLSTREWLKAQLHDGPVAAAEILKRAKADHVPERGLRRAKRKLLVVSSRVGGLGETGLWLWRLPNP
jgi:hypothetical protein